MAAVMITLPNTLGLFNPAIAEICSIVHEAGGLVYGDGANMNESRWLDTRFSLFTTDHRWPLPMLVEARSW